MKEYRYVSFNFSGIEWPIEPCCIQERLCLGVVGTHKRCYTSNPNPQIVETIYVSKYYNVTVPIFGKIH